MCAPEFPPYNRLLEYTPCDAIISHDWVKKYFGIGKVMELNEERGDIRGQKMVMENFLKKWSSFLSSLPN